MLEGLNQYELKQFCRALYITVQEYFKSPENRKAFEEYYLQKYGKPYVWKTLADKLNEERKSSENDGNGMEIQADFKLESYEASASSV